MRKIVYFLILITWITIIYAHAAELSLQSNSIQMDSPNSRDFQQGYNEEIKANKIKVKDADTGWKVFIKTVSFDMGTSGTYTKPCTDFLWRTTGKHATQTTYVAIEDYDIEVAAGSSKNANIPIDHRVNLSWENDVPGTYTIDLIYTLISD